MKINKLRILVIAVLFIAGLCISGCQSKEAESFKTDTEKELKSQNKEFDKCIYKFDDNSKELSLEFHYENDTVFNKETQEAIRSSVVKNISGKYKEKSISIVIMSDQSPKIEQYKYENGNWDKEVSE